jgi:hypothetical protein
VTTPSNSINVSTRLISSFIRQANDQAILGLEDSFIQQVTTNSQYTTLKTGNTGARTPVYYLVENGNIYYGLNTGFVQAFNVGNSAMTSLFTFEGLPLWMGRHAPTNTLLLHTNGLIHFYNIGTNALTTQSVPFVTSNYNFIIGNNLLLTQGNFIHVYDIVQKKLVTSYSYDYSTYSIVSFDS